MAACCTPLYRVTAGNLAHPGEHEKSRSVAYHGLMRVMPNIKQVSK